MGHESASKKRKHNAAPTPTPRKKVTQYVDLTGDESPQRSSQKKKRTSAYSSDAPDEEKRLKRWRDHAPGTYMEKFYRATSQRMIVIDRKRQGTDEVPEEVVEMAGTTGNVYSITICRVPCCTCPDNKKGNQCKHIIYVLHKVLKAPSHLEYQLAFLPSELRTIFDAAPIPSPAASAAAPSNRKEIAGDCPICFTEFEPQSDEIVFCESMCGNNFHKECFDRWAKSSSGSQVRCVMCRTPWKSESSAKGICKDQARVNEDGYVNVAAELGLTGARDWSTYHQPWVRSRGWGYY